MTDAVLNRELLLEEKLAEIQNLNQETRKYVQEAEKIASERKKLDQEALKLQAETMYFTVRNKWYVIAMFVGAGIAIGGLFVKAFT